jgi:hypothetical protein
MRGLSLLLNHWPARRWQLIALVLCAVLFAPVVHAQDEEPASITQARRATVFLMQAFDAGGAQALSCVGSGTVVSPNGLILTNAHIVLPEGPCRGEKIIVALAVRPDESPVPTYLARVVEVDRFMDLAVVQIVGGLDGSLSDPAGLNLPWVPLGDASTILPGNQLTFVGYPDIGSQSVAALPGNITAFTAEPGGKVSWLRTDAELGGGMTGGGAYNTAGQLVGIPSSAPAVAENAPGPTCRSIQDTNRDGHIDERDVCVPIGAPVSAIRPVNAALPLVEAARRGYTLQQAPGLTVGAPQGEPSFSRLLFAPAVDEAGAPTRIANQLPSGTRSVYLIFDYNDIRPGSSCEVRVVVNGLESRNFSLGPLAWTGGTRGTWYVGYENISWPDGNYEFTLFLNGQAVTSASLTIGPTTPQPTFKNLVFGVPSGSGLLNVGHLLPSGIPQVDARFDFEEMSDGQDWTEVWYLDGSQVYRETRLWERGSAGQHTVSALNLQGLPPGVYRLELYIGDRLAATGDLSLAGVASETIQPIIFHSPSLANQITRDGAPGGATGNALPLGTNAIYAFFNWEELPNGTRWAYRWTQDAQPIAYHSQVWDAGTVGENFWISLSSSLPLPEGTYALEVMVGGQTMFAQQVTIGSGAGTLTGQRQEEQGLLISGTVVDALTGEGVPGALIAALDVELESADFVFNQEQIYTSAISDREGNFSLPAGLQRGRYYTVYVFAEGYLPIVEDDFTIPQDEPSPALIQIELTRP